MVDWPETGPLVVYEAFGAGTPVLGSPIGGIAELVQQCLLDSSADEVSEHLRELTPTLVSFATVYPRVRAGLRAMIAIPLGLFGIVVGVGEAGYYSLQVGPSGDDYTGLLALASGFLLIGLGAATLCRRKDRHLAFAHGQAPETIAPSLSPAMLSKA